MSKKDELLLKQLHSRIIKRTYAIIDMKKRIRSDMYARNLKAVFKKCVAVMMREQKFDRKLYKQFKGE